MITGFTVSRLPPRDGEGRAVSHLHRSCLVTRSGPGAVCRVAFPCTGGSLANARGTLQFQVEVLGQGTRNRDMYPACSDLLHTPVFFRTGFLSRIVAGRAFF